MKKFILSLAAVLVALSASAQVKSDAVIQKAIDKAKANTENPKKAAKPDTWIKLGKAYMAAYDNPTANVILGIGEQELLLAMGNDKPLSEEYVILGGVQYKKKVFERKNIYFDPATGGIAFIEVTKPSCVGDALLEAYNAYVKAYEVDLKHKKNKDIAAALKNIADNYYTDAITAYSLGDYAKASALFAMAATVSATEPCAEPIKEAFYNAALTAQESGNFDKAIELYGKSMDMGYSAEGNAFSNLANICLEQKDTLSARKYLEGGFDMYPDNEAILTSLINLYLQLNEDPRLILDRLEVAKSKMPDNTSLYNVQGNLLIKVGEFDAALKAFRTVLEVDPKDPTGLFSEGLAWVNKAGAIQEEANALPVNEYKKYDAMMEQMREVYKKGLEPFEAAYELSKGQEQWEKVERYSAEYLKQIYFILRNEDPKYQEAYDKYRELLAQ